MAVDEQAGLTVELDELLRWREQWMAVAGVAKLAAELKELLHWQEQRMAVGEDDDIVALQLERLLLRYCFGKVDEMEMRLLE